MQTARVDANANAGAPSRVPYSAAHAATLDNFYARVMSRVCASYCEEGKPSDAAAVARLEQKWRQSLARYTGTMRDTAGDGDASEAEEKQPIEMAHDTPSSNAQDRAGSSAEASSSTASPIATMGKPSARLPSTSAATASSSVFAKMLGSKRKLPQWDGPMDDDTESDDAEADIESNGSFDAEVEAMLEEGMVSSNERQLAEDAAGGEEKTNEDDVQNETQEKEDAGSPTASPEKPVSSPSLALVSSPSLSLSSSSASSSPSPPSPSPSQALLSSMDTVPVSKIPGNQFPLQLAAEFSTFRYRGKRRGYTGELQRIVFTWPSRLRDDEIILSGDLLWCYSDSEQGASGKGELAEVLSLGDTRNDLKVKLPNGLVTSVQASQIRRLREFLIFKGVTRLRSEC